MSASGMPDAVARQEASNMQRRACSYGVRAMRVQQLMLTAPCCVCTALTGTPGGAGQLHG